VTPVVTQVVPHSVEVSPEVYKIIGENEYLRLIMATWEPGQADLQHYHPPFAAYSLTEIEGMLYYPDGTDWPVKIPADKPMVNRGDESHAFTSTADKKTQLLIVERKVEAPVVQKNDEPLSHVASPEVYKVVAENDYLRVVVATWQPGQRDKQHTHPPFAAYIISDVEGMLYYPDGGDWPVRVAKGKAMVQRGGESHAFKNVGNKECSMLIIEAK
ncbi:MAG: cupin domain-containing protein, partial [Desulfobulbaceae bacterium]|nr:cupin domain-containing protein [Desulfobulbaceae bacterium]